MPIVKYPHITNEHIDQLMRNGMGRFGGIQG